MGFWAWTWELSLQGTLRYEEGSEGMNIFGSCGWQDVNSRPVNVPVDFGFDSLAATFVQRQKANYGSIYVASVYPQTICATRKVICIQDWNPKGF